MRELRTDLLVEYVDEQTPPEPPPFEYVQHELGRRRHKRRLVATTAVVVAAVIAGATATGTLSAGEDPAGVPEGVQVTEGALDDGPPPDSFRIGTTRLTLAGEIPIRAVRPDPANRQVLLVELPPATTAGTCLPERMARILAQDTTSVRVAAYEYTVDPDQPEGQHCVRAGRGGTTIPLDLRQDLAGRRVLAGAGGNRVVLN